MIQPEPERPESKPPQVWGPWATIGFSLAIFVVYFVVTFIVAGAFSVIEVLRNPGIDASRLAENLLNNGLLIALVVILSGIAGLGFIAFFIILRKGFTIPGYLGLKKISWKIFLLLIGIIAVLFLISIAVDQFIQVPQDSQFTSQAYLTSGVPVLLWLAVVVFAPLFEECFFRGFLFVGLQRSALGAAGAILITALFWAVLHTQYSLYGIVTIFVLGIVFGIVRLYTKSLWSTLFLHAVWNFIALLGTALTTGK
jgi:membrane protease YdiL (CAAX protease family)